MHDENKPAIGVPEVTAKSARERFIECVKESGGSKKVAERLGVTRSFVDMIRAGQRRPGMNAASVIEEVFGIKMQDWIAPGTKAGRTRRGRRGAAAPDASSASDAPTASDSATSDDDEA